MNKNTKLWLNYIAGPALAIALLYGIYGQVIKQLAGVDAGIWSRTGWNGYLFISLALMVINIALESFKWYLLSNAAATVTYPRALASYLAGIAAAIVTPSRLGDYPMRILYLRGSNTFRYVSVSVLSVVSQLCALFLFGLCGLLYYIHLFPSQQALLALLACVAGCTALLLVYARFDSLLSLLERIVFLRKLVLYARLLGRCSARRLAAVLGLSVFRVGVFTAQYLFLLKWLNVNLPLIDGFLTAGLFFWAMAVIPSIAFTGLVVRTKLSILLFGHFSANVVGIIAATIGLWFLNLVVPAIAGSILMLRMQLLPAKKVAIKKWLALQE